MRRFTIRIKGGDAAIETDPQGEISRILREVAARLEDGDMPPFILRDINGNIVGVAKLT